MEALPESLTTTSPNPKNNIILMTDGYKFSHHKQYPVSWMPKGARPTGSGEYKPPVLYPASAGFTATKVLSLRPVPGSTDDANRAMKITIVTNVSTAVVDVKPAGDAAADFKYSGKPAYYEGPAKSEIVLDVGDATALGLPATYAKLKFVNCDESKLKRGSPLNDNFEGGYNVSYYTPRAYNEIFDYLKGDNIVFFGLQYFIKEYLAGKVVDQRKIDEADAFIGRYMADVRVAGPGYANGYDYTMFPRGDWEAMLSGDYDETGTPGKDQGVLPIKIEALPEGTTQEPGVCSFKITNTHPRFFWLPNFLETLLVQVWYPMSVATQAREFRKTIQAYSILSQRVSQFPEAMGPGEFVEKNLAEDKLSIHLAQVFDLLDFGYRGVSSHETAGLGGASYYTAGFEGSDTVAGSRLLLQYYNKKKEGVPNVIASIVGMFEEGHGMTSVPAAEHSTITSWADVSPDSDATLYAKAEYAAFTNMIKQYMPSFCVSLVSDGFNIWNAVANLWCSEDTSHGGQSMKAMLSERLKGGQLTLVRPDSGEGVETLPQLLTILNMVLNDHWQKDLKPLAPVFPNDPEYQKKYDAIVAKVRAKLGMKDGNPFRRCVGQQLRVLQGDGVSLESLPDMCASLLANGFCANAVHFGSGGGLLQKLNRDSLSVAFKCCAMYVGGKVFPVGKDPIAGGKKSYGGNPPVIRGADGVLRNRGEYDASGNMIKALPMTYDEFMKGCPGDELKKVFENGVITEEQNFFEIRERAKILKTDAAVKLAVDNLALKIDYLQKMSSDESIAIRLAEASCGSKWAHKHATNLADYQAKFPNLAPAFAKLGITKDMDSVTLLQYIKDTHVCDRKAKKTILRALADDDPAAALKAMEGKVVVTL